jgi:hypothetical protein
MNHTHCQKLLQSSVNDKCNTERYINCTWIRVVKVRLDQGVTNSVRIEEELDKDAVCHHSYLTYTVNTLPRKLLKVLVISK